MSARMASGSPAVRFSMSSDSGSSAGPSSSRSRSASTGASRCAVPPQRRSSRRVTSPGCAALSASKLVVPLVVAPADVSFADVSPWVTDASSPSPSGSCSSDTKGTAHAGATRRSRPRPRRRPGRQGARLAGRDLPRLPDRTGALRLVTGGERDPGLGRGPGAIARVTRVGSEPTRKLWSAR